MLWESCWCRVFWAAQEIWLQCPAKLWASLISPSPPAYLTLTSCITPLLSQTSSRAKNKSQWVSSPSCCKWWELEADVCNLFQTVARPTMVKLPTDPDQRLVIAAIGEAGEGKSTLLNLILNSPGDSEVFFDVSDEPEACTVSPSFRY